MMIEIVGTALFAVFSTVLVLETLKTLVLGTATSLTRKKLQKYINAEDAKWLGGDAVESDHPDAARVFRAQRNNLENLLPFFIAAGAAGDVPGQRIHSSLTFGELGMDAYAFGAGAAALSAAVQGCTDELVR